MVEKKFKVLTYLDFYVDENLLGKGIYSKNIPTLYEESTTMDIMVGKAVWLTNSLGFNLISGDYEENLRKCKLKTIAITDA